MEVDRIGASLNHSSHLNLTYNCSNEDKTKAILLSVTNWQCQCCPTLILLAEDLKDFPTPQPPNLGPATVQVTHDNLPIASVLTVHDCVRMYVSIVWYFVHCYGKVIMCNHESMALTLMLLACQSCIPSNVSLSG